MGLFDQQWQGANPEVGTRHNTSSPRYWIGSSGRRCGSDRFWRLDIQWHC
jgi:hypothetical protein